MPPKISLKIKFSVFIIVFTLILLTSLLTYLYFTRRNSIQDDSNRELDLYTQIFIENLNWSLPSLWGITAVFLTLTVSVFLDKKGTSVFSVVLTSVTTLLLICAILVTGLLLLWPAVLLYLVATGQGWN